jgi:hypothetical protein
LPTHNHPEHYRAAAIPGCDARHRLAACGLATFRTGRSAPLTSVIDCLLVGTVRNRLEHIQHRPDLSGEFLAQTGLILEPGPP